MAARNGRNNSKPDITQTEINRISNALKDEQFIKLLSEYAQERNDPANKKRYETEITKLEAQRGCDVTFFNPVPGYVIKTRNVSTGTKCFLNICSDANVDKPTSRPDTMGGNHGLSWSIPYSQSQPRKDIDRGGECCDVYDVIFHPDTLYLAGRDPRMKSLVHNTALDALEKCYEVKCDRNNLKFPRMKFKGVFRPTVIRRPLPGWEKTSSSPPTVEDLVPELCSVPNCPKYTIKYRTTSDLQDYVIQSQDVVLSTRPKEIIVEVELPLLDSAAGVQLDVQDKTLNLVKEEEPKYSLAIDLPYPVDGDNGSATFIHPRKVLSVTLPVKMAPQLKAERLSSNDSGIEEDTGYRIEDSDPDTEGYRTNNNCENEKNEQEELEKEHNGETEEKIENECSERFLDESIPYLQAVHTIAIQCNMISLTLDVKNVRPDSFVKQTHSERAALSVKFSSIGSGYVEIHHAFAIDFLIAGAIDEDDIDVEFWDNNVIVSLPLINDIINYKVGLSLNSLEEKELTLERAPVKMEAKNKKKTNKYKDEKHPKGMPQEEQEKEQLHSRQESKQRHGSGDSLDSCMSMSPCESVILKLQKDEEDNSEKTEESCDEDIILEVPPRYLRANSEDSTQAQPRGILKRKISGLVGTSRFRCYSESNLEDIPWSSSTGGSQVSTTAITEDEEVNFSCSQKKSVRFNEKVQQQLYRINSTILANTLKNKRKAEKKKRALERRMSESDAVNLQTEQQPVTLHSNMSGSSSLDLSMLRKDWKEEELADSGLASSFEENLVITDSQGEVKTKTKKMTKKRSKQFVMSNELIFDLDI